MKDFEWWRRSVNGEKLPLHESPAECGYYKMRDRRGLNADLAPAKRPFIAVAIWRGEDGELQAERAGTPINVEYIWPHCARYPISYEDYAYWHKHEKWPEKAA
ncbi:hypothetical protein [Maritalea porphyrae]|uniref:hypothetical protein n=1 Tax=Maritalea porphyrae TaxID=880732 RepID=UPI0022B03DF8|nr:hypothetical protein [Maritalea porphyrae]MCZ4270931.1 hypothetical protein [Maritalea porphyrae]